MRRKIRSAMRFAVGLSTAAIGWGVIALIMLAVKAHDRIKYGPRPDWVACVECGVVVSECQCREWK